MVSETLLLDYTISLICRIDVLHCYNAVYVARLFRGFFLALHAVTKKIMDLEVFHHPTLSTFLNIISSFSLVSLVQTVKETTGSSFYSAHSLGNRVPVF
jgi:hypothetical protein